MFLRQGNHRETILLSNIRDLSGRQLASHIWINYTAGFDSVGEFVNGDLVEFQAWVRPYVKGHRGHDIAERLRSPPEFDYSLTYPRNVRKIGRRCEGTIQIGGINA